MDSGTAAVTIAFLLTPPGGGDRTETVSQTSSFTYFYSRPRAGAIEVSVPTARMEAKFLLTPPGGGDLVFIFILLSILKIFLLTPPGGGDRLLPGSPAQGPDFYSRPRAGAILGR